MTFLNKKVALIPWLAFSLGLLIPLMSFGEGKTSATYLEPKTLIIGKVSSNPKKHFRFLQPIAEYVVDRMKDLGYDKVRVVMAKNNAEMVSYLKHGKVDWVTETPFSAMILKADAGAELLVRKWKKQVPEYHTVFFARRDSGISSLSDLKGKVIAFQDEGSTSAYYIPAYQLLRAGSSLEKIPSHRDKPQPSNVGYILARKEINMSTWVHKGIVDAAAFSNLDWAKNDNNPEFFRKDFIIFHKSQSYPRAIELVRKDLPTEVKERLKKILLNMHKDPNAAGVLHAYQKTKKFDVLTPEMLSVLEESESIINLVDTTLN